MVFFRLSVFSLIVFFNSFATDPSKARPYTDEFGPCSTTGCNYSMGDFVRYTVTPAEFSPSDTEPKNNHEKYKLFAMTPINPMDTENAAKGLPLYADQQTQKFYLTSGYQPNPVGYNIYYNMTEIPYAQDIFNLNENAHNLYNTVGYLFAGYAALNINPSTFVTGPAKTLFNQSPWLTSMRIANESNQGSLGFDNNNRAKATVQLIDYSENNKKVTANPFAYSLIAPQGLASGKVSKEIKKAFPQSKQLAIDKGLHFLRADPGQTGNAVPSVVQTAARIGAPVQSIVDCLLSNNGYTGYAEGACSWTTGPKGAILFISYFNDKEMQDLAYSSNLYNQYLTASIALNYQSNASQLHMAESWHQQHDSGYAAPYAQFFGGRLTHILGAVTNDVPASGASVTSTWAAMPTGTPTPQVAQFPGAATPAVGSTTPSTAHFGTLLNFLNYWSMQDATTTIRNSAYYSYLMNHIAPMLNRFATGGAANSSASGATASGTSPLCSYSLAQDARQANLIKINDNNLTGYDNGLVVSIMNNTGNQLIVKQCVAGASDNIIGNLQPGNNNFYLHTASLMPSGSSTGLVTTNNTPTLGNMIEIKDLQAKSSVFLQLMDATQVSTLIQQPGCAATTGSSGSSTSCGALSDYFLLFAIPATSTTEGYPCYLSYNQTGTYQLNENDPNQINPMYLVFSNFNLNNVENYITAYGKGSNYPSQFNLRVQSINIAEFENKPYCATLQINKTLNDYGLSAGQMNAGTAGSYQLFPSIVSVKNFVWLNPYAQSQSSSDYSSIPLILLPDFVTKAKIKGLRAHYGIWLMSYAAVLTEFKLNCEFGDTLDCLKHSFDIFKIKGQEQVPARVVSDANGILQSGQLMMLSSKAVVATPQIPNFCYAIMGCDVWDIGQSFHQDIPVLNLYADAAGNPVANQAAGPYINCKIMFAPKLVESMAASQTFDDQYGSPYSNTMIFSLPVVAGSANVFTMSMTKIAANAYQVQIATPATSQNPAAVLVYQTVVIDNALEAWISFLNNYDVNWTSVAQIPRLPVSINQTTICSVNYTINGSNNILTVQA